MNYSVADFIIQLKNASLAKRKTVVLPHSKMKHAMASVLVREGYLAQAKEETVDGRKMLSVEVKYNNRNPVITDVKVVSKPSLRSYVAAKHAAKGIKRGFGIALISTSQGIMTGEEAAKKGFGGELLCRIW
jgi:small subunit ribosomal protein S8